jgi:hypothetical protein
VSASASNGTDHRSRSDPDCSRNIILCRTSTILPETSHNAPRNSAFGEQTRKTPMLGGECWFRCALSAQKDAGAEITGSDSISPGRAMRRSIRRMSLALAETIIALKFTSRIMAFASKLLQLTKDLCTRIRLVSKPNVACYMSACLPELPRKRSRNLLFCNRLCLKLATFVDQTDARNAEVKVLIGFRSPVSQQ